MPKGNPFLSPQTHFLSTHRKRTTTESAKLESSTSQHPQYVDNLKSCRPHMITQVTLNDLIRDWELLKDKAELLVSRSLQWILHAENIFKNSCPPFASRILFPANYGAVSDNKRFHQDISVMKKHYQEKWSPSLISDYFQKLSGNALAECTRQAKKRRVEWL